MMKLDRGIFLFLSVFIISFGAYFFEKKNRELKLKSNLLETYAIYIGFVGGVGNANSYFTFVTDKNKVIEAPINTNIDFEIGDTVLIKYSLEDPNVAEIIDPCYMQKHKGKSYCK